MATKKAKTEVTKTSKKTTKAAAGTVSAEKASKKTTSKKTSKGKAETVSKKTTSKKPQQEKVTAKKTPEKIVEAKSEAKTGSAASAAVEVTKPEAEAKMAPTVSKAGTKSSTIDLKELLEAGAHFGHQARRWNPKMKPYIYTTRDNVHIFDLAITAEKLAEAMAFITEWVKNGREIVFVGCKRQAQAIVKEEAMQVGAPYVTERWLGGILTNWEEINKRIERLKELKEKRDTDGFKHYTKKERGQIDKEISRLERFFGGLTGLKGKPEALFVVDTHKEFVAVKEAKLTGIPVVGMVDTNGDPDAVTHIIPINDDAVRSIKLVVTKIGEAYAQGKGMKVKIQNAMSKMTDKKENI